ncbi:ferredoxin [Mycobacterium colombiense]|uniref:ferredoxin n=1 Tax=Mycobacterium colombiense TaxID=339268 RepID=UPI0007F00804|nr:ferredoxin [Mycobacterium colombiense]OBK63201.1 ferredoxin [Mycobacterium colombiense]
MMVRVNADRCQGHTLCAMIAPDVFELDDIDGRATVVFTETPLQVTDHIIDAARSCPEQAIEIEESAQ